MKPLSSPTVKNFIDLFSEYVDEEDEDGSMAFRQRISIAFNNLREQLIFDLLGIESLNSLNARKIISNSSPDHEYAKVLVLLRKTLKFFKNVESKEYIDYSQDIKKFLASLRALFKQLLNDGFIVGVLLRKKLSEMLDLL